MESVGDCLSARKIEAFRRLLNAAHLSGYVLAHLRISDSSPTERL
jgi:hypothetical protein